MKLIARVLGAGIGSGLAGLMAMRFYDHNDFIWYLAGFAILFIGFYGGQFVGYHVYEWSVLFTNTDDEVNEISRSTWFLRLLGVVLALLFSVLLALNIPTGWNPIALTLGTMGMAPAVVLAGFGSRRIWFSIGELGMFVFDLWVFAVTRHPSALGAAWICAVMAAISILFWTGKLSINRREPKPLHPQSNSS